MKFLFLVSMITISSSTLAAIFAEPVYEIKPSKIKQAKIKILNLNEGRRLVKLVGIGEFFDSCEVNNKKLKHIEKPDGKWDYQLFNYQLKDKDCEEFIDSQQVTYLIDSFVLRNNESIPVITINGKEIKGEDYETE